MIVDNPHQLLGLGITETTIAALCRRGLAGKRTAPMANPPGLVVTRYWITDAGRLRLKART
jgi:hypothetical protein